MQIETPSSFNNVVSIVLHDGKTKKLNHFQFNNYANAFLDEAMEVAESELLTEVCDEGWTL